MSQSTLGIIVAGGPAPGINGVISAATIEANNRGLRVVGFYDGFSHLSSATFDPKSDCKELTIADVARIHFDGGSILRTSRASLLDEKKSAESGALSPDPVKVGRACERLSSMGVTHLLTIGGDGTVAAARAIAQGCKGPMRFAHAPKTIDNDLPLPGGASTFGFPTARDQGAMIVKNLMEDARTTQRWYIVVTMGRHAGFLALGIAKAAGATLAVIPEEFRGSTTAARIGDVVEGAILKRRAMHRTHGVAVLAEGLVYKMGDVAEISRLLGRELPVDAAGQPRLSDVPLGWLIKQELDERFRNRGDRTQLVGHTLGYELRSAPPSPFDMSFTRDLGHGSVRLLLDESLDLSRGVMVALDQGHLVAVPFDELIDPATKRTRIRVVDLSSYTYRVARAYMIRLEKSDFQSPQMLSSLAREAKMSENDFRRRYQPMVETVGLDPADADRLGEPAKVYQASRA